MEEFELELEKREAELSAYTKELEKLYEKKGKAHKAKLRDIEEKVGSAGVYEEILQFRTKKEETTKKANTIKALSNELKSNLAVMCELHAYIKEKLVAKGLAESTVKDLIGEAPPCRK